MARPRSLRRMSQMRDLTNALAWRQQQFAQDIQQVVYAPLEAVRDAHKSTVADTVATSTAAQKEFANQRALVPKLKKAYEAKCKELDSAREELNLPAVRELPTCAGLGTLVLTAGCCYLRGGVRTLLGSKAARTTSLWSRYVQYSS